MKKYRIITNGEQFSVQVRVFGLFWRRFFFGTNEGGGSYYILTKTAKEAEAEYHKQSKCVQHQRWWAVKGVL